MYGQTGRLTTILAFVLVVGGFGYLLYHNAQDAPALQAVIPTEATSTAIGNPWYEVLQPGFGENTTPLPTIAIPTQQYNAPTLVAQTGPTATPMPASQLGGSELFTVAPVSTGVAPTQPPTSTPASTNDPQVTVQAVPQEATDVWQPPALTPPVSRDPLGYDHYFFTRPIDSSGVNFGISYYSYGSDGPEASSPMRIHTGLDMPNDIGSTVRATGAGTIIFASSDENPYFQNATSYGNVVVIEHDFSWQGRPLWTLYAHLQVPLVATGDIVQAGEPIALSGNTGRSSGPHVHYEVRMGENRYGNSYNPVLWMVPYVGRGTIAGRLVTARDNLIDDYSITLRNLSTASAEAVTTTYIFTGTANDVNSDPNWNENFVFGDVPAGFYEVVTTYENRRLSEVVQVYEGMTTFVELKPVEVATAQPVTSQP